MNIKGLSVNGKNVKSIKYKNNEINIGGNSCYHIELNKHSILTTGTFTISVTLQENYQLKSGETITFVGGTSTVTAITDSNGIATANITFTQNGSLTAIYKNVSDVAIVNIQTHLYQPLLDGTDPVQSIGDTNLFSTGNGYGGGYGQVGYVADGFDNSGNWEMTMTLQTSQWDGGFALLLNDYPKQTCSITNKWDCIYQNGQADMLQWIDGYIKINSGSNLSKTGISYTRNTTMSVKFIKNGTTLSYYENGTLKGTYNWAKLNTEPKVYIGIFTWGGSGSVNRFSNVIAESL